MSCLGLKKEDLNKGMSKAVQLIQNQVIQKGMDLGNASTCVPVGGLVAGACQAAFLGPEDPLTWVCTGLGSAAAATACPAAMDALEKQLGASVITAANLDQARTTFDTVFTTAMVSQMCDVGNQVCKTTCDGTHTGGKTTCDGKHTTYSAGCDTAHATNKTTCDALHTSRGAACDAAHVTRSTGCVAAQFWDHDCQKNVDRDTANCKKQNDNDYSNCNKQADHTYNDCSKQSGEDYTTCNKVNDMIYSKCLKDMCHHQK